MTLGATKPDEEGDSNPDKEPMEKRNSLFGDELMNFDPDELENDGWRDVFDDTVGSQDLEGTLSKDSLTSKLSQSPDKKEDFQSSSASNDAAFSSTSQNSTSTATSAAPPAAKSTPDLDSNLNNLSKQSAATKDSSSSSHATSEVQTPTTRWQNLTSDKIHREKMAHDM